MTYLGGGEKSAAAMRTPPHIEAAAYEHHRLLTPWGATQSFMSPSVPTFESQCVDIIATLCHITCSVSVNALPAHLTFPAVHGMLEHHRQAGFIVRVRKHVHGQALCISHTGHDERGIQCWMKGMQIHVTTVPPVFVSWKADCCTCLAVHFPKAVLELILLQGLVVWGSGFRVLQSVVKHAHQSLEVMAEGIANII